MSILDEISDEVIEKTRQRVQDGAAFLDEFLPHWYRGINIRKLSMATPKPDADTHVYSNAKEGYGCILCQLDKYIKTNQTPYGPIDPRNFGNYAETLYTLDIGNEAAESFGFDIDEEDLSHHEGYELLDILWTELIEERLAND